MGVLFLESNYIMYYLLQGVSSIGLCNGSFHRLTGMTFVRCLTKRQLASFTILERWSLFWWREEQNIESGYEQAIGLYCIYSSL